MHIVGRCLCVLWLAGFVGCRPADAPPPPGAGPATAAGTTTTVATMTAVATELEGTYTLKSETMDGRPAPADRIDRVKAVVIRGYRITVQLVDGTEHPTEFRLDPTRRPKQIDFVPPTDAAGQPAKAGAGIYKLEKGELVIAFNDDGDRPTTFDPAGRKIVQVLIRQGGK